MSADRPALIYFHVLANRAGLPAAVLLEVGAGDMDGLPALLDSEAGQELVQRWPCFHRAALGPGLGEALAQTPWRPLTAPVLARADTVFEAPPVAEWVEGDWPLAPPPKVGGAQAASRALALQLVERVAADADTHEIEALLRLDPTLSYQLLRLVNSLGVGAGRRITSFAQALLILGRQQLRRWLNLMLFAARQGDPRAPVLLGRVAMRACALERLARLRGLDRTGQEQAFMTGMFSLLGVLFGMPLSDVLAPLSIGQDVQAALLRHEGELGALLDLVEAAEQGRLDAVAARLPQLEIAAPDFNAAMLEAAAWMAAAVRESSGAGGA
jgi:EAL and modified HD-GYP domain-containing signal transduction protein